MKEAANRGGLKRQVSRFKAADHAAGPGWEARNRPASLFKALDKTLADGLERCLFCSAAHGVQLFDR